MYLIGSRLLFTQVFKQQQEMYGLFHKIRSIDDYNNRFSNGNRLGSGYFGTVYEVVDREDQNKVVAAVKHASLTVLGEKLEESIRQEVTFFYFLFLK